MHEHGLVDRVVAVARQTAEAQGGRLVGLRVRLGALAPEPARFQEDFEHLRAHHGLGELALALEHAPDRPTGVELIGVSVAR